MPETKHASPILMCALVTIIAIVGAVAGLSTHNPLWILLLLLPAVIYETIRTEPGASTKISSIVLLIVVILEIGLIVFGINYDLTKFFGEGEKYIAGYYLPLGDIKVFGPILSAILATVLVFRTYGPYTKWLAIVIALGSLVAVYILNPLFFQEALKLITNSLLDRFQYSL